MTQGIKRMRNKEKILNKLNDLLITNQGLEDIYEEASKAVVGESLKAFFTERAEERRRYNQKLSKEMEKLVGNAKPLKNSANGSYKVSMAFRNLIFMKDHRLIVNEVCRIKEISINKYNALLSELNLPLSLCKLLSAQRDNIQSNMNAIRRLEHLIIQDA